MRAIQIFRRRVVLAVDAFIDVVAWKVPEPVPPSTHRFKYRLAYVVTGACVVRFDNERGKGDHCHIDGLELPYTFINSDQLMADFQAAVARWNHEHSRS
ncbi:toxin-antitoxin system TumE family protein [Desulfonatronum thioautotrophicum]|uniref:toxin-antitoxin system TumE family protein n=1 Tax=Desulfonatronum thioautotrophicum TaxID=617001 RepID=UPI000A019699